MNIAICEDDAAERLRICSYIESYCAAGGFACIITQFSSGEELLSAFSAGAFAILFLDIYLGGISGIDVARKIRETDPFCSLVFITSSKDFALDGYAVRASSYVVKPITEEAMATALLQCEQVFMKNARYLEVSVNYQGSAASVKIPLIKIIYVEVLGTHCTIYTISGQFDTRLSLDDIEKRISDPSFLRCHRSFLVNMNHISQVLDYDFIMLNQARVPFRKNSRKEIRAALGEFATRRLFQEL